MEKLTLKSHSEIREAQLRKFRLTLFYCKIDAKGVVTDEQQVSYNQQDPENPRENNLISLGYVLNPFRI